MSRLRDVTPEQARAEAELLRDARAEADRYAAPLFARQLAEGAPQWVEPPSDIPKQLPFGPTIGPVSTSLITWPAIVAALVGLLGIGWLFVYQYTNMPSVSLETELLDSETRQNDTNNQPVEHPFAISTSTNLYDPALSSIIQRATLQETADVATISFDQQKGFFNLMFLEDAKKENLKSVWRINMANGKAERVLDENKLMQWEIHDQDRDPTLLFGRLLGSNNVSISNGDAWHIFDLSTQSEIWHTNIRANNLSRLQEADSIIYNARNKTIVYPACSTKPVVNCRIEVDSTETSKSIFNLILPYKTIPNKVMMSPSSRFVAVDLTEVFSYDPEDPESDIEPAGILIVDLHDKSIQSAIGALIYLDDQMLITLEPPRNYFKLMKNQALILYSLPNLSEISRITTATIHQEIAVQKGVKPTSGHIYMAVSLKNQPWVVINQIIRRYSKEGIKGDNILLIYDYHERKTMLMLSLPYGITNLAISSESDRIGLSGCLQQRQSPTVGHCINWEVVEIDLDNGLNLDNGK